MDYIIVVRRFEQFLSPYTFLQGVGGYESIILVRVWSESPQTLSAWKGGQGHA